MQLGDRVVALPDITVCPFVTTAFALTSDSRTPRPASPAKCYTKGRRKFSLISWQSFCCSCALLLGILSGPASPARPQTGASVDRSGQPQQSYFEKSMRMNVNLVLVPVSVTDRMNRPVMNLQRDDFALFQDEQPQKVEYFATEDAPVSVGLLLDVSRSMTSKFEMERQAVSAFFGNANQQDDYFAITFADQPKLVISATQSIGDIQSALAKQTPNGNTALFDAISVAAEQMRTAPRRRKALLIISDGADNHSQRRLKQIRRLVQDSDMEVYAIALIDAGPFNTLEGAHGRRWLTQITNASGGQTVAADSQEKIPQAAATISREMRSRYVLGYRPGAAKKSVRRKIRVEVTPHGLAQAAFHAYYKTGYQSSNLPVP